MFHVERSMVVEMPSPLLQQGAPRGFGADRRGKGGNRPRTMLNVSCRTVTEWTERIAVSAPLYRKPSGVGRLRKHTIARQTSRIGLPRVVKVRIHRRDQ